VSYSPIGCESMTDITQILNATTGDGVAAMQQLLPAVYEELRRMARAKMANESAGHTLQPTALVHEAWMRIAAPGETSWESRGHFFSAAAEAMRRILVDHARHKRSQKRGAGVQHEEFQEASFVLNEPPDELLAVHEALDKLASEDSVAAELVKLRYFVGMTMDEASEALGLSTRSAERLWTYARVWLRDCIRKAA
jgi:RNA polymerase sigma factor (TIGR02999 family)